MKILSHLFLRPLCMDFIFASHLHQDIASISRDSKWQGRQVLMMDIDWFTMFGN